MQSSKLVQGTIMTPEQVADAAYPGLLAGRRVVVIGAQNKVIPQLVRVLPRRVTTVLSRRAAEATKR